ncbi:hypothetical protein WPS_13100 [Vulcanimicrobium alpinum]|uniref:Flagellar FliJ protein n=1 Tax=Vulcanimicrobium alpinum TaxID=3016050 RepID=A0AAN1XV95_UNVUL|nr:flagellar export protein FliJ [Vulcanimicrobium alpinum]BDE06034.1 hypothetical protein WPS_13100 [Vulcanimicrobium alpinum]
MTAFRFFLDPVLRHRERIERVRAAEHAHKVADQRESQRVLDCLTASREAARTALLGGQGKLEAISLRATYTYLDYLDRVIVAARQRLDACAAGTDASRHHLGAAVRARKALETLKERRREAHDLEAALAEQRDLDEFNKV